MCSGVLRAAALSLALVLAPAGVRAETPEVPDAYPADALLPPMTADEGVWANYRDDFHAIPLAFWGGFATISFIGVKNWAWGSSTFHFHREYWFGMDTGSGGTDKLGHAFTSYGLTNLFAESLKYQGVGRQRAATSGALMSQTLMLYVELFDGFSDDHGFSPEDVVMNVSGATLAWLRQTHPQFGELVDYRMEYIPSPYHRFSPFSDYAGQKYLLAFKLGGVDALRGTPLKYLELQAGYYTRGFSDPEAADGLRRTRHDFVGIGINLNELLLGKRRDGESVPRRAGHYFFDHFQVPYTAATHARRL